MERTRVSARFGGVPDTARSCSLRDGGRGAPGRLTGGVPAREGFDRRELLEC